MKCARLERVTLTGMALLAIMSCAGDTDPVPTGPGGFARIEFEPLPPSDDAAQLLATLEAAGNDFPWSGQAAGEVGRRDLADPSGGQAPLRGMSLSGEGQPRSIEGPIPQEANGFNQVVLEAAAIRGTKEIVHLELMRDGKTVFRSRGGEFKATGGLEVVTFTLPGQGIGLPKADRFQIEFAGQCATDIAQSVSFVKQPLSRYLIAGSPGGTTRLVGDLLRRSISVTSESPRSAALELSEGEALELYVAGDPEFLIGKAALRFTVTLNGSQDTRTRSVTVGKDEWAPLRFTAAEAGAGPATLDVSVQRADSDDCAVGYISEAAIRRRGQAGPTVLLITSDTHRADHVGVFNTNSPVSTPQLDALAARGVAFSNCLSSTNVTNPSHMALMTGMHPRDIGILSNRARLAPAAETLAERFAAAGYETFAVTSSFHLLDQHSGLGQGFDRMEGPVRLQRDGEVSISRLVDWIDGAEGAPVFAWLHLFDAHEPYGPPKPFDRKYYDGHEPFGDRPLQLDKRLIPGWLEGLQDVDYPYAQYRAEVDYLDGALAEVLNHPRVRDGLVAFTADHGESFGEHGVWWNHAGLYPGTTRIPLIMTWKGGPRGLMLDAPVRHLDISRSLLALSGLEHEDFPGRDLREAVADDFLEEPRFMVGAHGFSGAVRSGQWLFTMDLKPHHEASREKPRTTGQSELFNLSEDPMCERDLLFGEPDRALAMRKALVTWMQSAAGEGLREDQRRSTEDESMLAALGYANNAASQSGQLWDPERWNGARAWEESPWRRFFEDDSFREKYLRSLSKNK